MSSTAPDSRLPDHGSAIWDLFCHVIDNWGDLGVCWRLASDLAARGQQVRLWCDQPDALEWMAPGALGGRWRGITVRRWPRDEDAAPPAGLAPSDVLVEAFGCAIQPQWVQALQPDDAAAARRVWINLEYLSAEPWVERSHALASPVLAGPLAGRTKWFYFPGFTAATGGLLREEGLMALRESFERETWRRRIGLPPRLSDPVVTLFCYEPPRLADLVRSPALRHAQWLVAPGRAAAALKQAWSDESGAERQVLRHLPQTEFDRLLWASDLNLVRGEDSLVRALWAGEAFVWNIYPQHDDAHHLKLEAFLDWLDAPASLRAFQRAWNGVDAGALPEPDLSEWRDCARAARARLLAQDDLGTQLLRFVAEKR